MSLSIGIVGLPNVGKSTLFQALTKKEVAIANYPFTTIEPNVAIVSVPDKNLEKLNQIFRPEKITPAVIEFIDIAGLVKEAHLGKGLGNQFLAKIRETNLLVEVVRVFEDKNVSHVENSIDPKRDIEIIKELSESVGKNEIIFRNTYSLYKVSRVQNKLKKRKIEQVDICGFDTDCCVLATAYDLFDSGYRPFILKDLCFSTAKEKLHNPALKIIERSCGFLSQ